MFIKHKILPLFTLILFLYFKDIHSQSSWKLPNSNRHYHEVTFLTAHNAYSNEQDGYVQSQQQWSLKEQLLKGIRGFMLDTHYGSKWWKQDKTIFLCHGNYALTRVLLRPFKGEPMQFKKSLEIIKEFLVNNPKEIVTIFLENYTKGADLDIAIRQAKLKKLILKPTDWDIKKNEGWPTLKWMQKKNKRLVIFNSKGTTRYIFDEWTNHAENVYSQINLNKINTERDESKRFGRNRTRYLYLINYFPKFYVKCLQRTDFKSINSENLQKALRICLHQGLNNQKSYKFRYPNFIAIDYVNEGLGMTFVNSINALANRKARRAQMYRPLKKI